MTTITDVPTNLSVERILGMDEREMYDVVDLYLKGRFARFAIDPATQVLLEQRSLRPEERDPEFDSVLESFRQQVYEMLYDPKVLPRHLLTLNRMRRAVEAQLEEFSDNTQWRRGALGFLNLVKDEEARAATMMERLEDRKALVHLRRLVEAVHAHRDADDADVADDELYAVADEIKLMIDENDSEGTA